MASAREGKGEHILMPPSNNPGAAPKEKRVMSIVITFYPKASDLHLLISALLEQTDEVLVVDNTPSQECSAESTLGNIYEAHSRLRVVWLRENCGIAAAQNVGIRLAFEENFDYVLLSDQDSLPGNEMVKTLRRHLEDLQEDGAAVGCMCPEYIDNTTGKKFGFQVQQPGRLFYSTAPGSMAKPWMEILTAISSGSLIPCTVLERVGLMREDFFIDYVDSEWCHRARHFGFHIYGTSDTHLSHRLGDQLFRIWLFGWRPYSAYSPLRLYYRFRNFILLMRCNYVPVRWKMRACWYWLGNAYAYLLFAPNRGKNSRFIFRGLLDGFRGRTGPFVKSQK